MLHAIPRVLFFLLMLLAISGNQFAHAAVYNWTGTGNWNTTGPWGGTVPTTGDVGNINSGTATANAVLPGGPTINVGGTGTLSHAAIAGAAPIAGSINVQSGGKLNWDGTANDLTPTFFDGGSSFGSSVLNNQYLVFSPITINSGTVTATTSGTVYESLYGLHLRGTLSGSGNLHVNPTVASQKGAVIINSTVANPFTGTASVSGNGTVFGVLALQGTGPLANATGITINPNGILRFNTSTDPLKANLNVSVVAGATVEWGGNTTYSYAPANLPTLTFANGSNIGRTDANVAAISREAILISSGATVNVSTVKGTVYQSQYGLMLSGPISGDGTLNVNPASVNDKSTLRIAPTTANPFTGSVVISGAPTYNGVVSLEGTGALRNVSALTLNANSILRFNNAVDALPDGFNVAVPAASRIEWGGATSYTGVAPVLTFANGSTIGRTDDNVPSLSRETLNIPGGVTLLATGINGTVYQNYYNVSLNGSLTGSGTLRVDPLATNQKGTLQIAPTTANPFSGAVEIGGNSTAQGYLALAGTGALANITSLSLEAYGALRFAGANNPLPSGMIINVPANARVEWLNSNTYSVTPPTLNFQNGSSFGRSDANSPALSTESIHLVSGATVVGNNFSGTVLQDYYGVTFAGKITGDDTTTLRLRPSTTTNGNAVMTINPLTNNASFAGNVILESDSSTYRGTLVLRGTNPLGAATLDVQSNSIVTVGTNGALDDLTSINIQNAGSVFFRVTGGSTLDNTTVTGSGLLRSEIAIGNFQEHAANYTLQPLTLTNTTLSPGNSAGTLSVEATTLTLGADTVYQAELGLTSDVLAVTGNLVLTSGSTLEISDLPDFAPGVHVIATYSGSLTGTFGTLIDNLNANFVLNGINYGTGLNSFISIDISLTPAPEPNTGLLAGIAIVGGMVVRRKKRA